MAEDFKQIVQVFTVNLGIATKKLGRCNTREGEEDLTIAIDALLEDLYYWYVDNCHNHPYKRITLTEFKQKILHNGLELAEHDPV